MPHKPQIRQQKPDKLKKMFAWLIVADYLILAFFLLHIHSLTVHRGITTSALLVIYNILLTFLCFRRARRADDTYAIYFMLFATILTFILHLYFFFIRH